MNPSTSHRVGRTAYLRDLRDFLMRNRALTLGVPLLVIAATLVFVLAATPVYEASTWIRVDEERSRLGMLDALKGLTRGTEIGTEIQVLRRRPLAEAVVDSLALHATVLRPRRVPRSGLFSEVVLGAEAEAGRLRFDAVGEGLFRAQWRGGRVLGEFGPGERIPVRGGWIALAAGAGEHEQIELEVVPFRDAVRSFRKILTVGRPDREANLIVVTYQSPDPLLVREVPNVLAAQFMVHRQDARSGEARGTAVFLEDQLHLLAAQLAAAEDALRAFREGSNVIAPEAEARAQITNLAELQARRDMVAAERDALGRLLREVASSDAARSGDASPYRRLMGFPTLLRNAAATDMLSALTELETRRAELLNRRTPEDPDVQVLTGRIAELEVQLRSLAVTYMEGLNHQATEYDATLQRSGLSLSRIPAREIQHARLQRQAKVLEEVYLLLQTRLKEAEITAAVEDMTVRVVEPAILPARPIRPNKVLSLLLAGVLGTVLGVGGAFAREQLDTSVRTREELQAVTGGSPVLALVPRIPDAHRNGRRRAAASGIRSPQMLQERLVTGRDPRNPVSESYRSLRTNLAFTRPEAPPQTLVFTSAMPGEGKSTTAANLAITMAQQGLRTALLDLDLRRGVLHEVFSVAREPGVAEVLVGRSALDQVIQKLEIGPGVTLDLVTTGMLPPNPAELAGGAAMRRLMEELRGRYEAVVMDTPPLNLVTDAALLGNYADGVLLVARAGVTDRDALAYAGEQLAAARATLLGTVLNDVDVQRGRYYGMPESVGYAYFSSES
jgi:capsular exopolysaccharide synthesis family protein